MEVKARDVDPTAVKKIDELAKKKRMSRSAYIKSLIETHAVMAELKKEEPKYVQLCRDLEETVKLNTAIMQRFIKWMEDGQSAIKASSGCRL